LAKGHEKAGRVSAFVIHVERKSRVLNARDAEARLEEAIGLAGAIDLNVVEARIAPLARPTPAT